MTTSERLPGVHANSTWELHAHASQRFALSSHLSSHVCLAARDVIIPPIHSPGEPPTIEMTAWSSCPMWVMARSKATAVVMTQLALTLPIPQVRSGSNRSGPSPRRRAPRFLFHDLGGWVTRSSSAQKKDIATLECRECTAPRCKIRI